MIEINIILLEIFSLMILIIFIFIYSILSTDFIVSFISFIVYLLTLIPLYYLIEQLNILIFNLNLEETVLFQIIIFYSTLISSLIGLCLFIEILYLFFFS